MKVLILQLVIHDPHIEILQCFLAFESWMARKQIQVLRVSTERILILLYAFRETGTDQHHQGLLEPLYHHPLNEFPFHHLQDDCKRRY